jgi:predicted nucleic acid-binding Zn ribbon protein
MWEDLGKLLPRRLEALRIKEGVDAEQGLLRWPAVAGRVIGAEPSEAKALSIKDGVLLVEVSSGIWASEIRLKEDRLVRELNEPVLPQRIRGIKTRLIESKNPGNPGR